jgi:putative flavoprotein involved in K+ transport
LVEYLRDYASELGLDVRTGTEVRRVDRDDGGWRVDTSQGELRAPCVVIALGHDREPFIPEWPGRDGFAGGLVHAATYREPSPFRGRDVLIISAANTGTEIAYELSQNGVGRVRNAMRSVPPVFPREWLGWPVNYSATFLDPFPDAVGDRIARLTQSRIYGDLSLQGIPDSTYGAQTTARRRHRSVLIDAGYVEALKAGEVELVAAVVGFEAPT